jgi:hypothetical protein
MIFNCYKFARIFFAFLTVYQNPTKYRSFFFHKLTFFHRFLGAYYDSAQSFFSARQVFEIILNESFKITKNAQIETP